MHNPVLNMLLQTPLGFNQFRFRFCVTHVSHVGMRHGVRADNMPLPSKVFDLFIAHHQHIRCRMHDHRQVPLDADYEIILCRTSQLAANSAGMRESPLARILAPKRPFSSRLIAPRIFAGPAKGKT